jgi:hypothetical protein
MEPSRPAAGWYPDPEREEMRYWDGAQWTEHVASYRVERSVDAPLSGRARVGLGVGGRLTVVLAVAAVLDGNAQGWEDGSFALVSYGIGLGLAGVGSLLCWKALRGSRERPEIAPEQPVLPEPSEATKDRDPAPHQE